MYMYANRLDARALEEKASLPSCATYNHRKRIQSAHENSLFTDRSLKITNIVMTSTVR